MSEKLTWATLPALAEGHERRWFKCKKCGAVGFFDSAPDAEYTHHTLPCEHKAIYEEGWSSTRMTEREARAETDFPMAATDEEPFSRPSEWWKPSELGARSGLLYD